MACLAVLVVTPAGAVFWFMNEAAATQAEAARRSVMEAYRGQLVLARNRIETTWRERAAALSRYREAMVLDRATRLRADCGADGIVLFDGAGHIVYPDLGRSRQVERFEDTPEWINTLSLEREPGQLDIAADRWGRIAKSSAEPERRALAARNQIRCLVRSARTAPALAVVHRWFVSGPTARARDSAGRLIAADEHLLALGLVKRGTPDFSAIAQRLAGLLASEGTMPVPQRLFLMDELKKLVPESPLFAGYDGARLALLYTGTDRPSRGGTGLQPASIADVWQLVSADNSSVALYRTATVASFGESIVRETNQGNSARFRVHRPGSTAGQESIALGELVPGWRLSLAIDQRPFDQAAQQRKNYYFLLGSIAIATIAITGAITGRFVNRQIRLSRLKTDLVAAVSHELRTPLASMSLLIENLLSADEPDPRTTREYLELIAGENERLRRLIQNFLTFSRIDRNRQTYRFESLAPANVVRSALNSLRGAGKGGPEVLLDVAPHLPCIRGDEDALVTVLLNLLDNACKYSPGEKTIGVRVFVDGERVAFAVSDHGIGLPQREQRKIFRRFYQVDRRLARESGGCGLGLSIVKDLVAAHGGTVSVTSAVGRGSTFEVRIPRWQDGEVTAA